MRIPDPPPPRSLLCRLLAPNPCKPEHISSCVSFGCPMRWVLDLHQVDLDSQGNLEKTDHGCFDRQTHPVPMVSSASVHAGTPGDAFARCGLEIRWCPAQWNMPLKTHMPHQAPEPVWGSCIANESGKSWLPTVAGPMSATEECGVACPSWGLPWAHMLPCTASMFAACPGSSQAPARHSRFPGHGPPSVPRPVRDKVHRPGTGPGRPHRQVEDPAMLAEVTRSRTARPCSYTVVIRLLFELCHSCEDMILALRLTRQCVARWDPGAERGHKATQGT